MPDATLTCPFCDHKQSLEIPQTSCLPFHKCENCQKLITVPKESKNCCVVCEFSEEKCPVSTKE